MRHHTRVGTNAVGGAVVHGRLTHPHHGLLHGQSDEVLKRRKLVATGAGRNGETTGHFVFPGTGKPTLGRGIGKFLELPRRHAHVGG